MNPSDRCYEANVTSSDGQSRVRVIPTTTPLDLISRHFKRAKGVFKKKRSSPLYCQLKGCPTCPTRNSFQLLETWLPSSTTRLPLLAYNCLLLLKFTFLTSICSFQQSKYRFSNFSRDLDFRSRVV